MKMLIGSLGLAVIGYAVAMEMVYSLSAAVDVLVSAIR